MYYFDALVGGEPPRLGWICERSHIMRGGVHSFKGSIICIVYYYLNDSDVFIVVGVTSRAPEKGERPALAGLKSRRNLFPLVSFK